MSVLDTFRSRYQAAVSGSGFDVSQFDTRNAARQAVRAANATGDQSVSYYDVAAQLPSSPVADGTIVGPGGAAAANEKPGVQAGETIEIDTPTGTITRTLPSGITGVVRLGDVVDVPSSVADTVLYVGGSINYQEDTAGDEVAAGTEGTPGDALADAASRATQGASNDGEGLVDSSGGPGSVDVATAGAGTIGVVAVLLLAGVVALLGGDS